MVQVGKPGAYHFEMDEQLAFEASDNLMEKTKWDWEHYQRQLSLGVAKEVARMGLPLNLMTQFYATVNARNLLHFIGLRTSPHALYEIRIVAHDMEEILAEHMPLTYKAWETKQALWAEFKEWKKNRG
jgi:thymidylate synthase (FAD)